MKRLLNYIIIFSLSICVFGCDSEPTIDTASDEYKYIEETEKGIVHYKGVPFNGSLTTWYGDGARQKWTYKEGRKVGEPEVYFEEQPAEEVEETEEVEEAVEW